MESNDYTSYEPLAFTVMVDNLEFDPTTGFVVQSDFAAFIHEWWHYIQDISTVTGQNGFYLWLRDMARISKITCSKVGEEIHVPLNPDEYGEPMSKYRNLYNIFCGVKLEEYIDTPKITEEPIIEQLPLEIDREMRTLPKCKVSICGKDFQFRLIALQEINCFYAQRIAEKYVADKPKVPADSLPDFPYKVGEMLFDRYSIVSDDNCKFLISYLCLDSIQAPAVFLEVVKELAGRSLSFDNDVDVIVEIVEKVAARLAWPNEDIYKEWSKDYVNWMNDPGHLYFTQAIQWFVCKWLLCDTIRSQNGKDFFVRKFCYNIGNLNHLYSLFPVPMFKRNGHILGSSILGYKAPVDFQNEFDNALVLWAHKRIFEMLSIKDREKVNELATCKLYDNCPYREKVGKDYDCKTAAWEVVQGETQAKCPYAIALHSMGLWQNKLVIDL